MKPLKLCGIQRIEDIYTYNRKVRERGHGYFKYVIMRSAEDLSHDDIYKALVKFVSHPENRAKSVHPVGQVYKGEYILSPFQTKVKEVCEDFFEDNTCIEIKNPYTHNPDLWFKSENLVSKTASSILLIKKLNAPQLYDEFNVELGEFRRKTKLGDCFNSRKVDVCLERHQGKSFIFQFFTRSYVSIP